MPPNSPKIAVESDLPTEETWNTSGTAQECSREIFHQTEALCDVTNMYSNMELDKETSLEQPNKSPTNPHSSKYNLPHQPKPNCIDNYRS